MRNLNSNSSPAAKPPEETKRDRILNASEFLFSRNGFHNTQIAEIAREAGTGVGTFYKHFADKDQLLMELLSGLLGTIRKEFVAMRAGIEHRSPLEQFSMIRDTLRLMLDHLVSRPTVARSFFRSGYGVNPQIDQLIWAFIEQLAADIIADLERAESVGLLLIPTKEILAHGLAGMVLQVGHKLTVDPKYTLDEAVNALTRFTLGGLTAFAPDAKFEQLMPVFRALIRPQEP